MSWRQHSQEPRARRLAATSVTAAARLRRHARNAKRARPRTLATGARPAAAPPRTVSSMPRTAATSCNAASAGSGAPKPPASTRRATTPATISTGGHADGYADYLGAEPVLRREFARTVDFIRRYCRRGRLLDVGCAYGFFLQEAKPFFDVLGIELAEDAAAHGRQVGAQRALRASRTRPAGAARRDGRDRAARRDRASAEPARDARAVRAPSQSRRHHRDHDRRFRLVVRHGSPARAGG